MSNEEIALRLTESLMNSNSVGIGTAHPEKIVDIYKTLLEKLKDSGSPVVDKVEVF